MLAHDWYHKAGEHKSSSGFGRTKLASRIDAAICKHISSLHHQIKIYKLTSKPTQEYEVSQSTANIEYSTTI